MGPLLYRYECTETNPITFLCYEGTHKTKFSVVSSDLIDYAVDVRKEATTAPLVFLEINPSKPGGNWRWGETVTCCLMATGIAHVVF